MRHALLTTAVAGVATALLAGQAQAATFTWNGGGTNDNLNTGANWVGGTAPAAGDGHDLQFAGTVRLGPLIPNAEPTWVVNSISFASDAGSFTLGSTPVAGRFEIGAGGITNNATHAQTINPNIWVMANQTFTTNGGALNIGSTVNNRTLDLRSNTLNLDAAVSRTIHQRHQVSSTGGTGTINLNGVNTSNSIINLAGSASSDVTTVINGGLIQLNNNAGLGGNLNWANTGVSTLSLNSTSSTVTWTGANSIPTNISLSAASGAYSVGQGNNESTIRHTGSISGTLAPGQGNRVGIRLGGNASELQLAGNSPGWTTTKTATNDAVVWMRRGRLVLDSPNALGLGNSLPIGLGDGNSDGQSRFYATSGNNVAANILVGYRPGLGEYTGTANSNIFVGLGGTGAVEFSGNLLLNPMNDTSASSTNRNLVLAGGLSATTTGTVTWSGTILDANTSGGRNYTVTVSLGTHIFTGANTYAGGTTVQQSGGGTTLLVNNITGSGTGTGPVQVNDLNALGGIGTIAGNVNLDGILRPGTPALASGIGTLTLQSNLTVTGTGRLEMQVSPTLSDQLIVGGSLGLTTATDRLTLLDVSGGPSLPSYTLISYGSRSGTFDQVFVGSTDVTSTAFNPLVGFSFGSSDYYLAWNDTAGTLTLNVVPEPSALGLLGLGALGMMRRRRVIV